MASQESARSALLIDIGSTYTKAHLFDLETLGIVEKSQAYTTVMKDVTIGLKKVLAGIDNWQQADYKLACSSAAGGLKLIAVGLVPDLTAEAARRAALGAGSKVLATYSYELSERELKEIISYEPDIILLAGGTDGGNKEVILHNAEVLAGSELEQPVIVAGNKVVADRVFKILTENGQEAYLTENVMPRLEELNIEPARTRIREIFLEKIIEAKGLSKVRELIDGIIMPTPAAVLKAAALLADGYQEISGLGELLVIDIGGATTDVHSIATGKPTKGNVNWCGLEEPYQKRTVEGDLGMRYSAPTLMQAIGERNFCQQQSEFFFEVDIPEYVQMLHKHVEYLPQNSPEELFDNLLARNAASLAVARHSGTLKTVYTPVGTALIQEGKDLTEIKVVIGTGGVIVNSSKPEYILEGIIYKNQENPELLVPVKPEFLIDRDYMLAAAGLLAEVDKVRALQFMKKSLKVNSNG